MGNDTILKASESFNGSFFQNANPKGNSGIRLATMKLKTLNTASKAPAIFFKNVKGASLQNISITGFSGIGILLENCDSIKAVNSRLEGEKNAKAKAVIRLNSSVDCIIAENKIKGNGKCGIALCEGSNNNVLDENVISKTEYGIQINSSYFNLLKDNNIEQTKIGVSLKSSTNSTLLGNTIKQSSNIAILLEDDKKSKLLRNSLSMITGKSAIKLIRSNGTVLQNKLISKNTGSGISAVKSKDMKLLFNIFDKNKKDLFDIDAKSKLKLESLNGVNKAGRK
jgi:parallel beta-helix repeat protein